MGWFTKDKKKSPEEEAAEKELKQQQVLAKEEEKKEKKAAELKKAEEKKAAELKKAEEKRAAEQKKSDDKKKEKEEKKKEKDDKKKGYNNSGGLNDEERKADDDDIPENIYVGRQQQGNNHPAVAAQNQQQQAQRLIKEEDVWIYESILQFFVSPTFLIPIGKFTDDKCIFFQTEVDPAPPSYKEAHNEFKQQMDELILGLGTDIGVEPDKIIELCESGLNLRSQKNYFSYMLVYFHLDEFIKAMVQKNLYMQNQAMKQIGKNSKPKNSEDDFNKAIESSLNATQLVATDKELQKAIMASQQEFELKKQLQDKEGEMLSEAIKQSKMNAGEIPQEDGKVDGGPRQAIHLSSQKIQKPIQKSNEDDDDDLIHIDDSDDEDDNLYVDQKNQPKAPKAE